MFCICFARIIFGIFSLSFGPQALNHGLVIIANVNVTRLEINVNFVENSAKMFSHEKNVSYAIVHVKFEFLLGYGFLDSL